MTRKRENINKLKEDKIENEEKKEEIKTSNNLNIDYYDSSDEEVFLIFVFKNIPIGEKSLKLCIVNSLFSWCSRVLT